MHLTTHELAQIQAFFRTKPVRRAWLFGSYARGEADAESDVDLLVDIDYEQLDALDFLLWHEYLAEVLQLKVDVVSGRKPGSTFYQNIEPDLKLVYEKAA